MGLITLRQTDFSGGELAPTFHGRSDVKKYHSGLRTCRNFVPLSHGALERRHGFEYCGTSKASTTASGTRLVGFRFSSDSQVVLEFTNLYLRFWVDGALVQVAGSPSAYAADTTYAAGDMVTSSSVKYISLAGSNTGNTPASSAAWWSTNYGVVTTYATADLFKLKFAQSGDVLIITHPTYPPRKLTRASAASWTLADCSFAASAATCTNVTYTAGDTTPNPRTWEWVVTDLGAKSAVSSAQVDTLGETLPSTALSTSATIGSGVNIANITWTHSNATNHVFNIYRGKNGVRGWVGQVSNVAYFHDEGAVPDYSWGPPQSTNPFASSSNYPAAVAYFDDRLCFGGTTNKPQSVWGSRVGDYFRFDKRFPSAEDASFEYMLASRELSEVRSLVSARSLVALTSGGAFAMDGGNDPLSPLSVRVRRQMQIPVSWREPLVAGATILFEQDGGNGVFGLAFSAEGDGYQPLDLSYLARHLFQGYTISDWCITQRPHQIVWAARSDGALLSFTYKPELDVWGWAKHDVADGVETYVESVACVTESGVDTVYAAIRYYSDGGGNAVVVERSRPVVRSWPEEEVFLDSAAIIDNRRHYSVYTEAVSVAGLAAAPAIGAVLTFAVTSSGGADSAANVGKTLIWYRTDPSGNTGDRAAGVLLKATITAHSAGAHTLTGTVTYSADGALWLNDESTFMSSTNNYALATAAVAAGSTLLRFADEARGAREAAYALLDGVVYGPLTVAVNGSCTLPAAAGYAVIGFRSPSQAELLDASPQNLALKKKRVVKVAFEVEESRGAEVGPDEDSLVEIQPDSTSDLETTLLECPILGTENYQGRAWLEVSDPTPCTILAVTREIDVE